MKHITYICQLLITFTLEASISFFKGFGYKDILAVVTVQVMSLLYPFFIFKFNYCSSNSDGLLASNMLNNQNMVD